MYRGGVCVYHGEKKTVFIPVSVDRLRDMRTAGGMVTGHVVCRPPRARYTQPQVSAVRVSRVSVR